MNRFVQPLKTIIISSAATKYELPWYIRFIRFLPLYKITPSYFLKRPNGLFFKLFGIATEDEKALLKQILKDTNSVLLKWSINAITYWDNKTIPRNLIHIHGNADKLLPIRFTKADIVVDGGAHFMVYSKANEISAVLNRLLHQPQL